MIILRALIELTYVNHMLRESETLMVPHCPRLRAHCLSSSQRASHKGRNPEHNTATRSDSKVASFSSLLSHFWVTLGRPPKVTFESLFGCFLFFVLGFRPCGGHGTSHLLLVAFQAPLLSPFRPFAPFWMNSSLPCKGQSLKCHCSD